MTTTRTAPNILVTGTPGTGKSTLAQRLAEEFPTFKYVDVGQLIKDHNLHEGVDEEFDALIPDEDKIVDELDPDMSLDTGGFIVDYHDCDFFPERWFDKVVVLRTDNTVLFDRLAERNYPLKKIQENVECEIMQVLKDQADESYKPEVVLELRSDSVDELDANIELLKTFINAWPASKGNTARTSASRHGEDDDMK